MLDATMCININDLKDKSCSLVISKVTHTIMKDWTWTLFTFRKKSKNRLWNISHGRVLFLIWRAYDTQMYYEPLSTDLPSDV